MQTRHRITHYPVCLQSTDPPTPEIESCAPLLTIVDPKFEMDTIMQEVTHQAREDIEPRHEQELKKHGLRPVWTAWDGYPGKCLMTSRSGLMTMDAEVSIPGFLGA